jgi:hypothetical protein
MNKNKQKTTDTPLVVLFKILATALLDDEYGINETAFNALTIMGNLINARMMNDLSKKVELKDGRYYYIG